MNQANKGNILKFNLSKTWQRHAQPGQDRTPFGLRCTQNRLLPFQLYFASGAGVVSWKLVNPVDPTGATDLAMTAADLTVTTAASGAFWVTWAAGADLTTVPDCGFWEIWLTVDSVVYYSEALHVMPDEVVGAYKFKFSNSTDKGTVLYQTGYIQWFYPTVLAWDRLLIEREVLAEVDGNNNETTRFSRTVARQRIEVADIPDFAIAFFAKCGDLSSVSYGNGTALDTITLTNVLFEARPQGVGLNIGVFTFDSEIEAFNGCQDNFEL